MKSKNNDKISLSRIIHKVIVLWWSVCLASPELDTYGQRLQRLPDISPLLETGMQMGINILVKSTIFFSHRS
jgi:hypothetical protein